MIPNLYPSFVTGLNIREIHIGILSLIRWTSILVKDNMGIIS